MAAHRNLTQQLYVAYYGRPADPAGLAYWADRFEDAEGDVLTQALDAFGTSAEYTASAAESTSEQLVQRLYQQLFGREADTDGLALYVGRLDDNSATLAYIAKQIADGAMGDDITALANKVTVANTFTDSVVGGLEYDASDIAAAQAVLAAVDATPASLVAGNLAALTAVVDLATVKFNLASAIATLEMANDAKAAFLLDAKGSAIDNDVPLAMFGDTVDPKTPLLEASLGKLEMAVAVQLGVLLGDTTFAGGSRGLQTALLADAKAANATNLAALQKIQATAQATVDTVPGLASAIAIESAAKAADTVADKAVTVANAGLAGAVSNYNGLNAIAASTITVDGALAGLIAADAITKVLSLVTGITDATNPGITNLLAAINTREAAERTAAGTQQTLDAAETTVNDLDLNAAGVTALGLLGAGFRAPPTVPAAPTRLEIVTEVANLAAADTGTGMSTDTAAQMAAAKLVADFNTLLVAYDAAADTDPKADALAAATQGTLPLSTLPDLQAESTAAVLANTTAQGLVTTTEGLNTTAEGLVTTLQAESATALDALFTTPLTATPENKMTADTLLRGADILDAVQTAVAADMTTGRSDELKLSTAISNTIIDAITGTGVTVTSDTATTGRDLKKAAITAAFNDEVAVAAAMITAMAEADAIAAAMLTATAVTTAAAEAAAAAGTTGVLGQQATDAAINEAADALALAQTGVDALAELDKGIAAAKKAFTDADLVAPVTLGAVSIATAKDDVFLVDVNGPAVIELSLFGADDKLFIGDDYLRNVGDAGTAGDDAVFEYFLSPSKAGAPVSTTVTLETSAFGSNADDPEVIEITLVGVALANVDVMDGFLFLG